MSEAHERAVNGEALDLLQQDNQARMAELGAQGIPLTGLFELATSTLLGHIIVAIGGEEALQVAQFDIASQVSNFLDDKERIGRRAEEPRHQGQARSASMPVAWPYPEEPMELDLELAAQLSASLDSVADRLSQQVTAWKQLEAAMSHTPADYPITGSGYTVVTPTTTTKSLPLVVACQGPQSGRQWQVRQLLVAGPTAGDIYFYAAASEPITSPLQIIGMKDTTKTRWPAPAFYGTHQFILNPRENLYVVVTTAPPTVQVIVSGTAEDYELAAVRAAWSE